MNIESSGKKSYKWIDSLGHGVAHLSGFHPFLFPLVEYHPWSGLDTPGPGDQYDRWGWSVSAWQWWWWSCSGGGQGERCQQQQEQDWQGD